MRTVAAILKYKGYQVTTIEPTALIAHVVDVLAALRIGAILVIDHTNQLLGIVGEREIMSAIAANGVHTLEMTAGQVLTRNLQAVHPATTVAEAMTMMTMGRCRPLARDRSQHACRPDQHWRRSEGPHYGEGERDRQSEDVQFAGTG